MQSLVKNGSQTSLDSKAFILLHVMQLKCSGRSQILHCHHRVTGEDFWGNRVWTSSQLNSWASIKQRGREGGGGGGAGWTRYLYVV